MQNSIQNMCEFNSFVCGDYKAETETIIILLSINFHPYIVWNGINIPALALTNLMFSILSLSISQNCNIFFYNIANAISPLFCSHLSLNLAEGLHCYVSFDLGTYEFYMVHVTVIQWTEYCLYTVTWQLHQAHYHKYVGI